MFVTIDRSDHIPITLQLYKNLKEAILEGVLAADSKLPSSRSLAKELHIARSTVVDCYEQLIAEG